MSRWRPTLPGVGSIGWFTAGLVAAESARLARRRRVGPTEARVFRWFNGRSGRIAVPVWAVMQSGSLGAVFVAAGCVARRTDARRAGAVAAVGTSVWIGAKVVKPLVGRGRPAEYLDDTVVRGSPQSGLGYPSGHAAVALTLALIVPAAVGRSPGIVDRAGAVLLGSATGAARMYVGAHLPLDIAGGFALGAAAGSLGSRMLRRR